MPENCFVKKCGLLISALQTSERKVWRADWRRREGRDLLSIIFNDFGRALWKSTVGVAFWRFLDPSHAKKRRYCGFSRKKEWRRRLFAKKEIDIVARGRKRRRRKRPFYSTSFFSASASSFLSQKTVKKEPKIDFWSKFFWIWIMLTNAFANFFLKLKILLRTKFFPLFILPTLPPPFSVCKFFFCLFLLLFLLPPERPIVSITTSFFTRFFLLKKKEKSGKLLWEEGEKLYAATGTTTTTTKILSPRPPPLRGLETFSGDFPSVSRAQKGGK